MTRSQAFRMFERFHKKLVDMSGPTTEVLIKQRKIRTPYPYLFSDRNFPLRPSRKQVLFVLLELENHRGQNLFETFDGLLLARPSQEQVIRFCSQLNSLSQIHVDRTIVFPHNPSFSIGVTPPLPTWLTLVWKPEKKISELCLFNNTEDRTNWTSPDNHNKVFFTGVFNDIED